MFCVIVLDVAKRVVSYIFFRSGFSLFSSEACIHVGRRDLVWVPRSVPPCLTIGLLSFIAANRRQKRRKEVVVRRQGLARWPAPFM